MEISIKGVNIYTFSPIFRHFNQNRLQTNQPDFDSFFNSLLKLLSSTTIFHGKGALHQFDLRLEDHEFCAEPSPLL